jgi:hypothetical protein
LSGTFLVSGHQLEKAGSPPKYQESILVEALGSLEALGGAILPGIDQQKLELPRRRLR